MDRKHGPIPKVVDIMQEITDKITYDLDVLDDFLSLVFGSDHDEDENIITWGTKTVPDLPILDGKLLDNLKTEKEQLSLFVGSSTVFTDYGDGVAYNRIDLFSRLFVIVVDYHRGMVMPKGFKPTYVINAGDKVQFGYVLKKPIENYKIASSFMQVLASSQLFDMGIPSPLRIIRLPQGIRGGVGKKRFQRVTIKNMTGPKYTPEKILDILDLGVSWKKLTESPLNALKEIKGGRLGASLYLSSPVNITAKNGEIDPITEWLFKKNMVVQNLNDKFNVFCPWSDSHASGGEIAEYTPIGNLDKPSRRNFLCHDPACKSHTIQSYLTGLSKMGAPLAAVYDITPSMLSEFVFDISCNKVWSLKNDSYPKLISMPAFQNAYPNSMKIKLSSKKTLTPKFSKYWNESPYRVKVEGRMFMPSTSAKLVKSYENELLVNRFSLPDWGSGEYIQSHVDQFCEFIEYLIPNKIEREYFLDWLSCKAKDMGFRGVAILMVAKKQGTGRNTLADMMGSLFGPGNLENVPFKTIVGNKEKNEWAESPIIVTDETLSSDNSTQFKQAYERLKEQIDPRPKAIRIDPKYGNERISMIHSSYLFMSNHENAIHMTETDRRFYVITNARVPASPAYFGALNKWMRKCGDDNRPIWAKHVWRWLIERPVNMSVMMSPPFTTSGKKKMMQKSQSKIELAIEGFLDNVKGNFITSPMIKEAIRELYEYTGKKDLRRINKEINVLIRERTIDIAGSKTFRINNETLRVRVILKKVTADQAEELSRVIPSKEFRHQVRADLLSTNESWKETIKKAGQYIEENYS